MRRIAWPSKSGIDKAMFGTPATSDCETGIIPLAVIGTLEFMGHRLYMLALQGLNVRSKRDDPYAKTPMYTAVVSINRKVLYIRRTH